MAPTLIALALATAALFVPIDFHVSTTLAATARINTGGATASPDVVRIINQDDDLGLPSATTLSVNGRVVAVHEEASAITANQWNWTFLLLGCGGLVVSQLARRRSRRGDFLSLSAISSADRG